MILLILTGWLAMSVVTAFIIGRAIHIADMKERHEPS